ncbi:MAG TPA: right-handed parallel beta-helix repeat-containing protein [Candidatus Polarisedimenticolaceae bacterium]|nr:right-handed parallel beta-helix repeat-containing protein [Candidatus Polarisedimenticolaceae bacterium]
MRALLLALLTTVAPATAATIYDVGPGQPYAAIGDVPWEALGPGDVVQIHWRSTPYKEKWVIGRQGTAAAPIVVRGIPGPGGERPVIDGDGATTRLALDYASEGRGVIKIGASSIPPDTIPKWIVLEGLHVTGARSGRSFMDDGGGTQSYSANASTIYVEKGENITVRDCELTDSGNGFFVASSDAVASRNILVDGCFIHDNGNVGSIFEHNLYVAGIGMTFQHNRLGPLLPGASGNNLKDRSAGLVVRYNWIEGGNRQLDLVDGEDSALIRSHPGYGQTHVYGNVLIEPDGAGNRQLVHYGGDSGTTANYRKGMLWLYGNTFISRRTDVNRTTLVRLSTSAETCDARDNIVYLPVAGGTSLSLMDTDGVLHLSHNWLKPGYRVSFGTFTGTVADDGTSVTGTNPGFVNEAAQDFHLAAGSACRDAGAPLDPAVLPAHALAEEYVVHQSATVRPEDGALDIGAHEFCNAAAPGAVAGLRFDADRQTLRWTDTTGAQSYDVLRGSLETLRESEGDFDAASDACPADDLAGTALADPTVPSLGTGVFWLVRGVGCGGLAGTWDDGGLRQSGPRNAQVCP